MHLTAMNTATSVEDINITGFCLHPLKRKKRSYTKGDRYYIPAGVKHSAKIYAGVISFFMGEKNNRNYSRSQAEGSIRVRLPYFDGNI